MKKLWKILTRPLKEISGIYYREMRICTRDVGIMLFFLFLPLAYPVIYSLIYNPEVVREVPVVVIDRDRTAPSRELTRKFNATPQAKVIGYAADLPEARRAVDSQKAFAILEIPQHYARDLGSGQQVHPVLYCDMSLLLRYRELMVAATNVSLETGSEIQASRIASMGGESLASLGNPMDLSYRPMGNISSGFDSFIMPGVLMLILHQAIVLAIGMRGGATQERRRMTGYYPLNYVRSTLLSMVGQCLAYFTLLFVPVLWLVHFVPLIFDFPMAGDTWQILAFLFPYVLSAMMIGYCVQCLVTERETIFVVWVITSIALLFLSGLTWPLYAMHFPWNLVTSLLPSTWGLEGFIRMNGDGATLTQVIREYRALWILCLGYGVMAYLLQRFVVRPRARLAQLAYAIADADMTPEDLSIAAGSDPAGAPTVMSGASALREEEDAMRGHAAE